MTGSGVSPRTGSATGTTVGLCADYESSCNPGNSAADKVYWVKSDVDGMMTVETTATNYNPVLYVELLCGDKTTELGCDDQPPPTPDKVSLQVYANSTYYVVVDGGQANNSGTFSISVTIKPPSCGDGLLQPPELCDDGNNIDGDGCSKTCQVEPPGPNDTCPGVAMTLTGTGNNPRVGSVTGTTAIATDDYEGTCTFSTNKDVVYSFKSDIAGTAEIDLGGAAFTNFDAVLYARNDCTNTASSAEMGCDDAGGNGTDTITFAAEANKVYYVFVDGYGTKSGNFKLNVKVSPPQCGNTILEAPEECDDGNLANGDGCSSLCKWEPAGPADLCPGQALTLTQQGNVFVASISGTTANMGKQYVGTCGTYGDANDAVFQFNSGALGGKAKVELLASGTNFDSVLYVRKTSCTGTDQVACDDATGDGGELIEYDAPANTTYWVFVDGYSSTSGSFSLKVTIAPPMCGNGVLEGAEECDDSNTKAGDGCSATCMWEGSCGAFAESEPNPKDSPQTIPPACGSFKLSPASMPIGDADYFKIALAEGATVEAWTYVGNPGQCAGFDSVISLWKSPVASTTNESGGCQADGYVTGQCNDTDSANAPCSHVGPYSVPAGSGGDYVVKVYNYTSSKAIPDYGLLVMVK